VAIAGAAVAWLRDNIGIVDSSTDIGELYHLRYIYIEYAIYTVTQKKVNQNVCFVFSVKLGRF